VDFAARTGTAVTFSPNGTYGAIWDPLAVRLRPLIATGQVQIGNHTWSHPNLEHLSSTRVRSEIDRNEQWIEDTFGITARPWFRPPYGFHDRRTDEIAGELGFTNILLWNGTFGDATLLSPAVLMTEARKWLQPTTIMLGHANHPTIVGLFDQIADLIHQRSLTPVTLDKMFSTSRSTG
jgi:peptidoglycan/xylan/chitin deacetylase (PgdA/CDA1 family)